MCYNLPMAQKKTKPKKKLKTLTWEELRAQNLTLQQELFCQYYVKNADTRGNGSRSYNLAYNKKLEEQPKDDAVYDEDGKLIETSSYFKCENVCKAEASLLLSKPNVNKRVTELLNEILTDEMVDAELAKVITQDEERSPKVRAMELYAKIKGRVVDQSVVKHTLAFDDISEEELDAIIAEESKIFKK